MFPDRCPLGASSRLHFTSPRSGLTCERGRRGEEVRGQRRGRAGDACSRHAVTRRSARGAGATLKWLTKKPAACHVRSTTFIDFSPIGHQRSICREENVLRPGKSKPDSGERNASVAYAAPAECAGRRSRPGPGLQRGLPEPRAGLSSVASFSFSLCCMRL